MRYRRSPMCRFCWERGHTSLNCPEAKAKANAAKAKDVNDITYKDREAIEILEKKQHVAQNRTCTYCGEGGHNVRGCEKRDKDIEDCTLRLQGWRNKALEAFVSAGYGIGAIITHNGYSTQNGYCPKGSVYTCMIHKIEETYMNYWSFNAFHNNGVSAVLLDKMHDRSYMDGYYLERPYIPAALVYALCVETQIARYENRNDKVITTILSPSYAKPFDSTFISWDACKKAVTTVFNGDGKKKPSRSDLIYQKVVNMVVQDY